MLFIIEKYYQQYWKFCLDKFELKSLRHCQYLVISIRLVCDGSWLEMYVHYKLSWDHVQFTSHNRVNDRLFPLRIITGCPTDIPGHPALLRATRREPRTLLLWLQNIMIPEYEICKKKSFSEWYYHKCHWPWNNENLFQRNNTLHFKANLNGENIGHSFNNVISTWNEMKTFFRRIKYLLQTYLSYLVV